MICRRCNKKFDETHGNQKLCEHCKQKNKKEYFAEWRRKNRDKINEKKKTVYKEAVRSHEKSYVKDGHRAWRSLKDRCRNPKNPQYDNYGARGIKLMLTKEQFMQIYFRTERCEKCGIKLNDENRKKGNGRTLDRIDPAGNYEERNLRVVCRSCNSSFVFNKKRRRR